MELIVQRCPWYVAGPLIGALIVGLRAMLNKPLGALGGYIDFAEHVRQPRRLGFSAFLLLGFVLGGAAFALASSGLTPSLAYGRLAQNFAGQAVGKLGLLTGAGLLMGFGARTAGGCTSGHGMCGTSLGSRASLVATGTFFAVAVAAAHVLALFGGMS